MNSETFTDSPRIFLLSTVQGNCRQFSDKPDFRKITVDSPKWELSHGPKCGCISMSDCWQPKHAINSPLR